MFAGKQLRWTCFLIADLSKCFPATLVKIFRTAFLKNTFRWQFLLRVLYFNKFNTASYFHLLAFTWNQSFDQLIWSEGGMVHTLPLVSLTLSWCSSPSGRNHSIDLHSKSTDWFLYDRDLRHERVKILLNAEFSLNSLIDS